ncbi:lysoplasmalogenase TMEM86A isoform X2 [Bombus fervidus]|uniref:lysoplasmalogenase TMEM86A isoform X2 n=1 Tax=Bombus fervidus TaxID=203811 RepID=UPI003AB4C10B
MSLFRSKNYGLIENVISCTSDRAKFSIDLVRAIFHWKQRRGSIYYEAEYNVLRRPCDVHTDDCSSSYVTYRFSRRILTGLIFSCIGDALLVWPSCFTPGMCMFALAQIMYISAFGFIPLNIMLGTILYALCSLVIYALMPGLNGILVFGVPVYTVLLTTMAWRAISRVQFYKELWTWTKLCSCIGSICFLISDTLLGFHYFHTPLPYSQVSIMLTYYAAQLGIALSAVGSKNSNNNNNNNVSNDKTDTVLIKG